MDHVTLNFNNNLSTAAVFLDIEKAFAKWTWMASNRSNIYPEINKWTTNSVTVPAKSKYCQKWGFYSVGRSAVFQAIYTPDRRQIYHKITWTLWVQYSVCLFIQYLHKEMNRCCIPVCRSLEEKF